MCREYNRIFKLSIISEQIGHIKTTDSALLGVAVVHLFKKEKKNCIDLSIIAKSEVARATCFLGQKVIWNLSLVKKWDQGSNLSASLHLRGAGEGQL